MNVELQKMIFVNSFLNVMNLCMIICKLNIQCVMIKKKERNKNVINMLYKQKVFICMYLDLKC